MAPGISTTMSPVLWGCFNYYDPSSWSERITRFASSLPSHSLGQQIRESLMEAFYADQEGMYLRSHFALCAAEELLLEVGALESFILAMAEWRPADPGDEQPSPSPKSGPVPGSSGNQSAFWCCCALPFIVAACMEAC